VKPGDHVVVATLASCGMCRACNTGHPTCASRPSATSPPRSPTTGEPASNFAAASVFAEYTIISEVQAVKISKDVPFTSASLIGCGVLTGIGAVFNRATVQPGETAAVFGVGGIGLNVIQALRVQGASGSSPSTPWPPRRPWPASSGPPTSSTPRSTDAVEEIRKIVPHGPQSVAKALGPGGVTWSFECVGHPAVLRNAVDALDWGGNAIAIGVPPRGSEVSIDINNLAYVDRGLLGCRYGSSRPHHDIPLMVEIYLDGKIMLDELGHRDPSPRGVPGDHRGHGSGQAGPAASSPKAPERALRSSLGPISPITW
jgi:Zn-dependent alcohol dehydrogenase